MADLLPEREVIHAGVPLGRAVAEEDAHGARAPNGKHDPLGAEVLVNVLSSFRLFQVFARKPEKSTHIKLSPSIMRVAPTQGADGKGSHHGREGCDDGRSRLSHCTTTVKIKEKK